MPITVRLAMPADARAIAEVHVRAWQDGYRGLMPEEYLAGLSAELDARTERWRERLAAPKESTTLVGLIDDELVGIASTGPTRDADHAGGEVRMINLIARAWGTGLGQALFDDAMARLRAAGFSHATLWVLATNVRARRFYERNGWAVDGAIRDEDKPGFTLHEVRYRISL